MKLTTQLHLIPTVRMRGAIPALPNCTTLPLKTNQRRLTYRHSLPSGLSSSVFHAIWAYQWNSIKVQLFSTLRAIQSGLDKLILLD